jgi:hypothetical protein
MQSFETLSSAMPGTDMVILGYAITAALAVALPLARSLAGKRLGEPPAVRHRATLLTVVGMIAYLGVTGALAAAGVLGHWDRVPPSFMPAFVLALLVTVMLARSSVGRSLADGLPLALLVGFQGFRIPVEIMLHRAAEQGVIGWQMSWSGLNFDVVSGIVGAGLGLWLWQRGEDQPPPRALLWGFNLLGLGLLTNIVTIAVLSMPTPFRAFDGPPNVFVASVPFVWLPTVMVMAALLGHLLLFRRLRQASGSGGQASAAARARSA